jgi:hypothetical protein
VSRRGEQRIAVISSDGATRGALAGYLRGAGFDVHECSELELASGFGALVVISQHGAEALVAEVRALIKTTKSQRIVVVTARPSALKPLLATHAARLAVLAAPAFGWDVVDALRANHLDGPRGA